MYHKHVGYWLLQFSNDIELLSGWDAHGELVVVVLALDFTVFTCLRIHLDAPVVLNESILCADRFIIILSYKITLSNMSGDVSESDIWRYCFAYKDVTLFPSSTANPSSQHGCILCSLSILALKISNSSADISTPKPYVCCKTEFV